MGLQFFQPDSGRRCSPGPMFGHSWPPEDGPCWRWWWRPSAPSPSLFLQAIFVAALELFPLYFSRFPRRPLRWYWCPASCCNKPVCTSCRQMWVLAPHCPYCPCEYCISWTHTRMCTTNPSSLGVIEYIFSLGMNCSQFNVSLWASNRSAFIFIGNLKEQ